MLPIEPDLLLGTSTPTRTTSRGGNLLSSIRRTFTPTSSRSRSPAPLISAPYGLHSTQAERRAPSLERSSHVAAALNAPSGSAARPSIEQIALGLHLSRGRGGAPAPRAMPPSSERPAPRRAHSMQVRSSRSPRASPQYIPTPPRSPPPKFRATVTAPPSPPNGRNETAMPLRSSFKKPPASPSRSSSYPLPDTSSGTTLAVSSRGAPSGSASASSLVSSAGTLVPPPMVITDARRGGLSGMKARMTRFLAGSPRTPPPDGLSLSISPRTSEDATLAYASSDDGHGKPRKAVRFTSPTVVR